jgi:hypothetical protein
MAGLRAVGGVVVVELDMETVEIPLVLVPHPVDELLRGDALLLGAQHDGRAVGIVGAAIDAGMARIFWKRTQISVWMYSTRWPRWMLPLA